MNGVCRSISIGDLFKYLCQIRTGYHPNSYIKETGVVLTVVGNEREINELIKLIGGELYEVDNDKHNGDNS